MFEPPFKELFDVAFDSAMIEPPFKELFDVAFDSAEIEPPFKELFDVAFDSAEIEPLLAVPAVPIWLCSIGLIPLKYHQIN